MIHDTSRGRLKCKVCKKTFNHRRGTALEGIRKPDELFVTVISLISSDFSAQFLIEKLWRDEESVKRKEKNVCEEKKWILR